MIDIVFVFCVILIALKCKMTTILNPHSIILFVYTPRAVQFEENPLVFFSLSCFTRAYSFNNHTFLESEEQ